MGRAPCCDKANVKKGPWSPEEDSKLKEYIEKYGTGGNWIALPQKAGLKRCGKSCRLRWLNYLRPNIKHGDFSDEEDRIICNLFANIGSRWSIIAAHLPGRTDNDIKNYWNTKLKKKLMAMAPRSQRKHPPFPQSSTMASHPLSSFCKDFNGYNFSCYTKSLPGFDPVSQISSSLLGTNDLSTDPSSLFQIPEGLVGSMQYCNNPPQVKENNILVFGSEASCSSNSDGSCSQISYGRDHHIKQEEMGFQGYMSNVYSNEEINNNNQKFILSYGTNSVNDNNGGPENLNQWGEKSTSVHFGETSLDFDLEDVKQLIGSTNNSNHICSSFLVDEDKITQDKASYYYY